MQLSLSNLALIFILFLLAYSIWQHLDARRLAQRSAKNYCDKVGVQFLDQNVILRGLSIARSPRSLFALRRQFGFEFSSVGDRRYIGFITLLGQRVVDVELEPYKTDSKA